MHKHRKLWLLPLLMISLGSQPWISAHQPLVYQQEVIIGISIHNPYNVPLSFRLRRTDGRLKDVQLSAGDDRIFKNYDHIWIYSQSGSVDYRLENECRYIILWNERTARWDLFRRTI